MSTAGTHAYGAFWWSCAAPCSWTPWTSPWWESPCRPSAPISGFPHPRCSGSSAGYVLGYGGLLLLGGGAADLPGRPRGFLAGLPRLAVAPPLGGLCRSGGLSPP